MAEAFDAASTPKRPNFRAQLAESLRSGFDQLNAKFAAGLEALIASRPRLLLAILALIWLIPGTASLTLVDRDEPRFAHATQEMLDRGEAIVPYFNGEYRFDKPPLVYWWMRAHYLLFGYNDFSARLHSVEATLLVVLLIWSLASRMYNPTIGWWSAFAFLSCLQVFEHGRLCLADMPMMVFILLAQWALWELLQKSSWKWSLIFWGALALGFTTKWVVPWAVTGFTFIVYALINVDYKKLWRALPWNKKKDEAVETLPAQFSFWGSLKALKPLTGPVVMLALILCWAIPAWQSTNGQFFFVGLGHHVFDRSVMPIVASRPGNPFFYVLTAFISLMPWLAFIGAMFVWLRSNWSMREKFLVAWAAGAYVIFTLAQTQLPHYAMPAFPALLIMIVAASGLLKPEGRWSRRFFYFAFGLWVTVLTLALIVVAFLPVAGEAARAKLAALLFIVALGALIGMGWAKAFNKIFAMALCFVLVPLGFWGAAAAVRPLTPAIQVRGFLDPTNPPQVAIASGFEEPSLTAYTQVKWNFEADYGKARAEYNSAPNSAAFVVLARELTLESVPAILLKMPPHARRDFQKQLLREPPVGGERIRMEGVNLGRFSWVTYELYLKQ